MFVSYLFFRHFTTALKTGGDRRVAARSGHTLNPRINQGRRRSGTANPCLSLKKASNKQQIVKTMLTCFTVLLPVYILLGWVHFFSMSYVCFNMPYLYSCHAVSDFQRSSFLCTFAHSSSAVLVIAVWIITGSQAVVKAGPESHAPSPAPSSNTRYLSGRPGPQQGVAVGRTLSRPLAASASAACTCAHLCACLEIGVVSLLTPMHSPPLRK